MARALWLYFRFNLSLSDVEQMLPYRGCTLHRRRQELCQLTKAISFNAVAFRIFCLFAYDLVFV